MEAEAVERTIETKPAEEAHMSREGEEAQMKVQAQGQAEKMKMGAKYGEEADTNMDIEIETLHHKTEKKTDDTLTDRELIHYSSCIPSSKLKPFARQHLKLSDADIENAHGANLNTVSEYLYQGLQKWKKKNAGCTNEDLTCILHDGVAKGLVPAEVVAITEQLIPNEEPGNIILSRLADRVSMRKYKEFLTLCLGVSLPDIESRMPVIADGACSAAFNVLLRWKSKHGHQATQDTLLKYFKDFGISTPKDLLHNTERDQAKVSAIAQNLNALAAECEDSIERNRAIVLEHLKTQRRYYRILTLSTALLLFSLLIKYVVVKYEDQIAGALISLNRDPLSTALSERYKADYRTLTPVPWLKDRQYYYEIVDHFIPISLTNATHQIQQSQSIEPSLKTTTPEQSVTFYYNTILQYSNVEGDSGTVILVEGSPGSGKSTFMDYIAYTWAIAASNIRSIFKFKYVIMIKVNLLESNDTLYHYIRRELLPEDERFRDLEDLLRKERTLFIIDGYDEAYGNTKIPDKLISKRLCKNSVVIFTMRSGSTLSLQHHVHYHYSIKSLSTVQVHYFIDKFSKGHNLKTQFYVEGVKGVLQEIVSTPFYLWYFMLIGENYFEGLDYFTITKFFSTIFEALKGMAPSDTDSEALIIKLSDVAYVTLLNGTSRLPLESGNLCEQISICTKTKSSINFRVSYNYYFAHRIIQEYLAAYYINRQSMSDMLHLATELLQNSIYRKDHSKMVLKFLFGFNNNLQNTTEQDQMLQMLCNNFIHPLSNSSVEDSFIDIAKQKGALYFLSESQNSAHLSLMCNVQTILTYYILFYLIEKQSDTKICILLLNPVI